jgi:hypothetical protein
LEIDDAETYIILMKQLSTTGRAPHYINPFFPAILYVNSSFYGLVESTA